VTRIVVFAFPLLLPLQVKDTWGKIGRIIHILGTLIYFASWLSLIFTPGTAWSNSNLGLLAARLTPFLSFLGIALIGQS